MRFLISATLSRAPRLDCENKLSTTCAFHLVQFSIQIHSSVKYLHVLSDRCVADGVGRSGDGGLAAVAAATAVQAGHVDPVQVILVLPSPVAQRLILAVLVTPANIIQHCKTTTTRGTPCPI